MTTILIAESDGVAAQRMLTSASSAGADVQIVEDLEAALEQFERDAPTVLAIGPSLAGPLALELAAFVTANGSTSVVLVTGVLDAQLMREAMRSGVSDVISASDTTDDITEVFSRALANTERTRAASGNGNGHGTKRGGSVVTVFSTKGGVGKTVLATNIGVALSKNTGKRVVLLDLDLEFGDVGIMLGVKPAHTIYDCMQAFDRLDDTMLLGMLEEHSSGLHVLLAPVRPEEAESVSAARVSRIITLLRNLFDFVIIDTSPSFSEIALSALDKSDQVYVVTMMDVASIKNTRISMQKLKQLGYNHGRVRLVLNRADSKVLLEPHDVEQAIGEQISARIPSDRVVPRSVNKGVPVVLEAPKSEVARAMVGIAKGIVDAEVKEQADVA